MSMWCMLPLDGFYEKLRQNSYKTISRFFSVFGKPPRMVWGPCSEFRENLSILILKFSLNSGQGLHTILGGFLNTEFI